MNSVGPLLAQLEAAELPGHLQHLTIRLSRQFAQVLTSSATSPNDQHEHWTRLRGRLEEIEEELREAAATTTQLDGGGGALPLTEQARGYLDLAERSKSTREQLARELQVHTLQPRATPSRSTPSRDVSSSPEPRPRKARPAPSTSSSTTASSALEALLQSSASTAPPPASTSSAQAKASALSSAFTLHLLATSPSTILPPGASLSSLLRSQLSQDPTAPAPTSSTPTPPSLESRISSSLRTAYFAQHLSSLQDGLSGIDSAAAARVWKQLRLDLWTAAGPLIPARLGGGIMKGEVEEALISDEEGAFELEKAIKKVRSVVELLGELCAPAKDGQVRALLSALSPSVSPSASTLMEGLKRALELAEGMQDDLSGFRKNLAGATMTDEELEEMVKREAGERERRAVRELLGEEEGIVEERTKGWVEGKLGEEGAAWAAAAGGERKDLLRRAMWEALFDDQAVAVPSCDSLPPSSSSDPSTAPVTPPPSNPLPPPFHVPSPRLFALQNTLQALVILACLAHLSPPPAPLPSSYTTTSSSAASEPTLQSRLWSLLSSTSSPTTRPEEYTHLAHISDDILAAWAASRSSSTTLPEGEAEAESIRIRNSVDRILRYEDPVFRLMKGRLREGLLGASWAAAAEGLEGSVPASIRSGRELSSVSGSGPGSQVRKTRTERRVVVSPVKGFEGVFVRERLDEAAGEGLSVWEWAAEVWSSDLGLGVGE